MPNKYGKNLPVKPYSSTAKKSYDEATIRQESGNAVFEGLLKGTLKPPKSVQQGILDAGSNKHRGIEEALRRDFGVKSGQRRKAL